MALFTSISTSPLSIPIPIHRPITNPRRLLCPFATLSSSSSPESAPAPASARIHDSTKNPSTPFVESSRPHDSSFNYAIANPTGGNPFVRFVRSTESNIERVLIPSVSCLLLLKCFWVNWLFMFLLFFFLVDLICQNNLLISSFDPLILLEREVSVLSFPNTERAKEERSRS